MSIDPEDSLLEQALRGDLPSSDTEGRLRRRMLAAGIAVGNGVATTAAVASGSAATTGAAASGLFAKVAGLSWGIKVGLAAAVAIPTVGLWLDGRATSQAQRANPTQSLAASAPRRVSPQAADFGVARGAPVSADAAPAVTAEPAPNRALKPNTSASVEPARAGALDVAHPSQADFGGADAPARRPEVGSTLAAETRLLDSAFAELAADHRERAAALLREHAARYPDGLLRKERERAQAKLSELSRGE